MAFAIIGVVLASVTLSFAALRKFNFLLRTNLI